MTMLTVEGLATEFDTVEGTVYAVNGVSFAVDHGETLAVVGESGSGKSVTMLSLVGLVPRPPGRIVAGQATFTPNEQPAVDLLALSERKIEAVRGAQIGFIFQDPISSLNPVMKIGWQIAESMTEHLGIGREEARRRTIALLAEVGIADAERRFESYPHEFSGGMRQRVMIAIAMACNPPLLIADEPTTALDVTVQAQIIDLARRLQAEYNLSLIWITHDLAVVAGLADRVVVMYGGTVVEDGLADDIFERPQHPYTIGLLGAIPSIESVGGRLASIDGSPPDLHLPLTQCPFAPRCPYVLDRCWDERPLPVERTPGHRVACFVDVAEVAPHER